MSDSSGDVTSTRCSEADEGKDDLSFVAERATRLVDADERFDHEPRGDPPISTGQYRRIARAVLTLDVRPETARVAENASPEECFFEGWRCAVVAVRRIVATELGMHPENGVGDD